MKYFSVRRSIKIGGKLCKPCVCYPVTDSLRFTVTTLVEQGIAVAHEEEVFFQNGRMLDPKQMADKARNRRVEARLAKRAAKDKSDGDTREHKEGQ